jgi:hypothetical protein
MKKYIAISLLVVCALLAGYLGFQKFHNRQVTQCLPDSRMASSAWRTYVSKVFKFSVEYPEVLIPLPRGPMAVVSFVDKNEAYTKAPLSADIYVDSVRPENKDGTSGIKSYQCAPTVTGGGPNNIPIRHVNVTLTDADVYHGSNIYNFSIVGMSRQDAERIVKSIKFLE